MKIWYPQTLDESKCKNVPDYLFKCQASVYLFKLCLRRNINNLKWNILNDKLKKIESINFVRDIKAISIANQYISSLQCSYDYHSTRCYFYVPDNVRCIGTTTPLNYVIRIIEYGSDEIPAMNWIRHSYLEYKDLIAKDVQQ
jgi:hypothetical protein